MNLILAKIASIQRSEQLCLVDFEVLDTLMSMVSLALEEGIKVGDSVLLGVKASNVSLAKGESSHLSLANQLQSTITSIKEGEILSSVRLSFAGIELESIITTRSLKRLALSVGEGVVALIKSSELSIMQRGR